MEIERLDKIEKQITEIKEMLKNIENNIAFLVGYISSTRK